MDELLALSDRILVMFKGRIMGEAPAATGAVQQIGLMMLGKTGDAAGASGC